MKSFFFNQVQKVCKQDTLTWALTFARMTETDSVMPGNGDVYFFYSTKTIIQSMTFILFKPNPVLLIIN
jgi:hypothetical protein